MIWNDLARTVIGLGAPMLGTALAGPLGGAAGKLLADALGASAPTPAAVQSAIVERGADSAFAAEAVQKAETEWARAIADIAKAQLTETGATMRAEAASGDALQRWWRPLYALELSLLECPAFALTLMRALWIGHDAGIEGFAALSGLLIAYFAARFGVLGVYVTGRSREKQALATGEAVPSVIGQVVRAAAKRR
jgi:hypothetical protein